MLINESQTIMVKTSAYNPLDHLLQSDAEIAEYLTDAYQDEDSGVFIVALGHVVKHKGIARMAEETGINQESLYKTFNGNAQPGWDTIHRLLRAIGVRIELAA